MLFLKHALILASLSGQAHHGQPDSVTSDSQRRPSV